MTLEHDDDTPVYVISVAAQLTGLHAQTLRQYDRLGLVTPGRSGGGGRRYSARDVALLREVQRLSQEEGVNLAGIKRIIELENEVGALRAKVQELTEQLSSAMAAAEQAIRPGARKCDIAAAITEAQIRGTEEFGGDYTAIVPLLPTGESADTPHLTWSEDRLKEGEPVVVELAGAYQRYHVPLNRTFSSLVATTFPNRLVTLRRPPRSWEMSQQRHGLVRSRFSATMNQWRSKTSWSSWA
mgnify:CR=1 FL=1